MVELDHLLLGAPDLEAASDLFADLTGATPAHGGAHPGHGTRNHLIGMRDGIYLEIIAPDPDQDLEGTLGAELARLTGPTFWSVAFRSSDLPGRKAQAEADGAVTDGDVFSMSRARADGTIIEWSILRFHDVAHGTFLPFFIDWKTTPHPSTTLKADCALEKLELLNPHPEVVAPLVAGTDVDVSRALRPGGVAHLSTPRGRLVLT